MMPRMDGKEAVYLALALSTIATIYGYAAFAMPHILRIILR